MIAADYGFNAACDPFALLATCIREHKVTIEGLGNYVLVSK